MVELEELSRQHEVNLRDARNEIDAVNKKLRSEKAENNMNVEKVKRPQCTMNLNNAHRKNKFTADTPISNKGSAEWRKPLASGRVSAPVTVRKKTKEKERVRGVEINVF